MTLGKQTSDLQWNWTLPFRELSGAEKNYFAGESKVGNSG